MTRVSLSAEVLEEDLADIYRLLLDKELARAASATVASVPKGNSDRKDERSEWQAQVGQVWLNVMPQSRAALGYLVEQRHRANNPIGFRALEDGAGIPNLGGAIKSIHHWTYQAGLPEYALLRARIVQGATVYWVEEDVAEFVRTLM
jgi:hypothetical protein